MPSAMQAHHMVISVIAVFRRAKEGQRLVASVYAAHALLCKNTWQNQSVPKTDTSQGQEPGAAKINPRVQSAGSCFKRLHPLCSMQAW